MRVDAKGPKTGRALKERREAIAESVTNQYFQAHPLIEQHGKEGRRKCTEDNRRHIDYLCEALCFGRPGLFAEYAVWIAALLARLKIPGEALTSNLMLLRDTAASGLPDGGGALVFLYVDEAIAKIQTATLDLPGHLQGSGVLDILARDYLSALLAGERHTASRLILGAVEAGVAVKNIYLIVFQRVLHEIGRLWQLNEINVAQEHYCTAATQLIMSQLYPHIFTGNRNGKTFVGTCVAGDLHEIGCRMIADFLEMAGWNTFYLGANTPADSVVRTLVERKANVLGVSATITLHLGSVEKLIQQVRAEPACAEVKVLVGGYPFNLEPDLWRSMDADGSARDADSVIALAERLTSTGTVLQ
jgi:methanogenic corrinoid protein MtbC1